jgi:hypothetical protein
MTNEQLLDEVEEFLKNHGLVKGVQFSEAGYLHRVRAMREEIRRQAAIAGEPSAKPMNGKDVIPEMTDPLGRHWSQPDRQYIFIRDGKANMCMQDFSKLSQYDTTFPTGVYPGKMWKRINGGVAYLCWYGEENADRQCPIHHMVIEVAQQEQQEAVPA